MTPLLLLQLYLALGLLYGAWVVTAAAGPDPKRGHICTREPGVARTVGAAPLGHQKVPRESPVYEHSGITHPRS